MSLDASPPALGNTTTALGSHEWLMRATDGATQAPSGLNVGVVTVNVFVVNWTDMSDHEKEVRVSTYPRNEVD